MSTPHSDDMAERLLAVQRLVDDFVERRLAGEPVDEAALRTAHPELMPELGEELQTVGAIARARRRAGGAATKAGNGSSVAAGLATPRPLTAPDSFPGYELRSEIHRGGQGVVYQAWQAATQRLVAIKVLRGGALASSQELSRFEREVQVLANLRHPNIVAVHDSGVGAAGSLYFVMDYVAGKPLDEHFSRESPPAPPAIQEILRTLIQVCDAVHAAHLRGVIHRDIKPSNVRIDKDGTPRVLDFGLAKLLDDSDVGPPLLDVHQAPTMTASGQFVGSLPWSSPEQARGESQLDIRTDVYSLGVVLFYLLTRSFPYEVRGLTSDVIHHISSTDPKTPRGLNPAISRDLETVVLCCLAKDRGRRYQSAADLRDDLQRCLSGEPVDARRDNTWHLVRKLARRHRGAIAVGGSFVALTTAAAIALAFLYAGQVRERARAEEQAQIAEAERSEAQTQRDAAQLAKSEAEATVDFLRTMLAAANTSAGKRADVTVREILFEAAQRVGAEYGDRPAIEARLRSAIGGALNSLGLFAEARPEIKRAFDLRRAHLPPEAEELRYSLLDWGGVLSGEGKYDEALPFYEEALAHAEAYAGADSTEVAYVACALGGVRLRKGEWDEAERLLRRAIEIYEAQGVSSREHGDAYNELGALLMRRGNALEARGYFETALRLLIAAYGTEQHTNIAGTKQNVAAAMWYTGERAAARAMLESALETQRELLPAQHPTISLILGNLAAMDYAVGDLAAAERRLREALEISVALRGPEHPEVFSTQRNLALILGDRQDYAGCEALYREVLEGQLRLLPPEHPDITTTYNMLGRVCDDMRRMPEAEEYYRIALQRIDAAGQGDTRGAAEVLTNLANAIESRGDDEAALAMSLRALKIFRTTDVPGETALAGPLSQAAQALNRLRRFEEAEPYARENLDIRRERAAHSWTHASAYLVLARSLCGQGRFDEAAELLACGESQVERVTGGCPPHVRVRLAELAAELAAHAGDPLTAAQRAAEAAYWRRAECALYRAMQMQTPGVWDELLEAQCHEDSADAP